MRFAAIATDYDGTLASQGRVDARSVQALHAFRERGRTLILVTGRELDELLGIFPEIDVFDRVVAENGALLYCPRSREHKLLGSPPPLTFVRELERRGVAPLSVGRSIVATVEPHETTVLAAVRDLGLELQVIFNKGAVMVLPAGVNKATGLAAALEDLKLSMRNVAAIGDAENDHAMLRAAEFGVAVANALPALVQEADHASPGSHADAVIELMEAIVRDDLAILGAKTIRRRIPLGNLRDGAPVALPGAHHALLIHGSTSEEAGAFASGLLQRMRDEGYQCCIVDIQGRHGGLHGTVALGTPERPASAEEVASALGDSPGTSVVVALSGVGADEQHKLLAELPAVLGRLRARNGRPHSVFVDLWPDSEGLFSAVGQLMNQRHGIGLVLTCAGATTLPEEMRRVFGSVVALGMGAEGWMQSHMSDMRNRKVPLLPGDRLAAGEALMWTDTLDDVLLAFRPLSDVMGGTPSPKAA